MAACVAMVVLLRNRQTSSTARSPASVSATVAGCSVSQKVAIASRSSFSSTRRASGVKRGWAMAGPLEYEFRPLGRLTFMAGEPDTHFTRWDLGPQQVPRAFRAFEAAVGRARAGRGVLRK